MKSVRSKLLLILLVCVLVSATSLVTGCKSVHSGGGAMSLRAAEGTTVATATPGPANPRDRILGPARNVVPPNIHTLFSRVQWKP